MYMVHAVRRCTLLGKALPLRKEAGMDKDQKLRQAQKKSGEKFNSITQKSKPENQNQTHNVRSEAVEPKIRQV